MSDPIDEILDTPKFLRDLNEAQPLRPVARRTCMCGPLPLVFGFVLGIFILLMGICIGTYL